MPIILNSLPVVESTGEILKDRTDWRTAKLRSLAVAEVLELERRAERMQECSTRLVFEISVEGKKRLKHANFCRDRMCPSCQRRRSLVVYHQVQAICTMLLQERPTARFVLLTLTIPNVSSDQLSSAITAMFRGWKRLSERGVFQRSVLGWFRGLEVTYNCKREDYHPHFHCLLVVPPSYFSGKYYLKHEDWLNLWRGAMRDSSITQVDVRAIKRNPKRESNALAAAAAEVGKYATKPSQYVQRVNPDEFKANKSVINVLARALKHRRLVMFGGQLRELAAELRLQDAESDSVDLVHIDSDQPAIEAVMVQVYRWHFGLREYVD